jgi:hypothetical protein
MLDASSNQHGRLPIPPELHHSHAQLLFPHPDRCALVVPVLFALTGKEA